MPPLTKTPGRPEVIILRAPRWGALKLRIPGLMRKPPESRFEQCRISPPPVRDTAPVPVPVAEGLGCMGDSEQQLDCMVKTGREAVETKARQRILPEEGI